jgi:glutathionyl-hydroquinone reductase
MVLLTYKFLMNYKKITTIVYDEYVDILSLFWLLWDRVIQLGKDHFYPHSLDNLNRSYYSQVFDS